MCQHLFQLCLIALELRVPRQDGAKLPLTRGEPRHLLTQVLHLRDHGLAIPLKLGDLFCRPDGPKDSRNFHGRHAAPGFAPPPENTHHASLSAIVSAT